MAATWSATDGGIYAAPVAALAEAGVFVGTQCGANRFCASASLDRQTMAVWTVRVLDGADPAAVSASRFSDVDPDSFHAPSIERMTQLGVTAGCGDGTRFCPGETVTRAQMAIFLWRASLRQAGGSAPYVSLPGVKHVVYDRGAQHVWLIEADGSVLDDYPVSGKDDIPTSGQYQVFSKSVDAWSFTPGVTMKHMVRFARGPSGAAIGFHSIPRQDGVPIQTEQQLGQFRSAGCVRQRDDKAEQLYEWAPIGTPVVVLA